MSEFDVIVVGAGIAGASIAAELAPRRTVLLLETESSPGYHATGRSAAFWSECYGGPGVQGLTKASGAFLANPPPEFSARSFLSPRGALHIAQSGSEDLASAMIRDFDGKDVNIAPATSADIARLLPKIRGDWTAGVWEPDCCDIDVATLHAAYLRKARRGGVRLACNARVTGADYRLGGWEVTAASQTFRSKLLINAAGAWADNLAEIAGSKPVGIRPLRRSMAQVSVTPGADPAMPLVIGLDGSFYFKPNADGTIWLSPHDETPSAPADAAPDEHDIAVSIARLQQVVDWKIGRVQHKWAGLRSFAPDRLPVIGEDPRCAGFFWLAGQGGFGIQTAPAAAMLAASLILREKHDMPAVDANDFSPARFD
jgi:D-arginine dehydrogenase